MIESEFFLFIESYEPFSSKESNLENLASGSNLVRMDPNLADRSNNTELFKKVARNMSNLSSIPTDQSDLWWINLIPYESIRNDPYWVFLDEIDFLPFGGM